MSVGNGEAQNVVRLLLIAETSACLDCWFLVEEGFCRTGVVLSGWVAVGVRVASGDRFIEGESQVDGSGG